MKKLFALLVCLLLLFALASCDFVPCRHRDADDNSLCDNCGESYTDGKDLPEEHTHDYTVKNIDNKYLDKAATDSFLLRIYSDNGQPTTNANIRLNSYMDSAISAAIAS